MDLMVRSRSFPGFSKPPFTPGVDVVGTVDSLGDGVSAVAPGEEVAALLGFDGGYAEFVCVAADLAVVMPEGLDPAAAVCGVANYLTAHTMMHRVAAVEEGERILVHGAAGGVGTALLELGRMAGLEMYGTASKRDHDALEAYGAVPIDYRNEDFVDRIRVSTGDGVDAVFDPIGGFGQLWRSYRTLRKGGRLVWFGVAGWKRNGMKVIPGSLLMRLLLSMVPDGKRAPLAPDSMKPREAYRDSLARILGWIAEGSLQPLIAARYPLAEAASAHEFMEQGGYRGKVVLVAG
jgi:NADPH:quinone reductase-like Zn-dependent oxidoreductase